MGHFGQNCSETCSIHCQKPEECDHLDGSCMCQPGWKGKDCKQGKVKVCQKHQRSLIMLMVLVCVSLDGRVKIVNKVKVKSVRNQRSAIMWMVLVCVSLDGRVKIVNKVK